MNSVDTATVILGETEWAALYRRLAAYAMALSREMPAVFDGISPDDLVSETIVAYLAGESGMGWDPHQGSLDRFLCGVLKNKFLMHARRIKRLAACAVKSQFVVEPPSSEVKNVPAPPTITDQIELAARGDEKLEKLVEATQELDGMANANQQLSQLLGTTEADVVNRKKRLTRRLDRAVRAARRSQHHRQTQF